MEYSSSFKNGFRRSADGKGIQIFWYIFLCLDAYYALFFLRRGRSGYGGGFPSSSLCDNIDLMNLLKEFNLQHLAKEFDKVPSYLFFFLFFYPHIQVASKRLFLTYCTLAFFVPLIIFAICLILILTLWNWDSRGVIFNFGFTFLAFLIFISATLIISLIPLLFFFFSILLRFLFSFRS